MSTIVQNDKEMALNKMRKAIAEGKRTVEITLNTIVPEAVIDYCLDHIEPGQRLLIALPDKFSKFRGEGYDPDAISELTNRYCAPEVSPDEIFPAQPDDIFIAIRVNQTGAVIVDVYCAQR